MTLTRRAMVQGSLAVAAATCSHELLGLADKTAALWMCERALITHPVAVPQDFVGMHAHRWPMGDPSSPTPTYGFGAARSHDYDGAAWYRIHKAPGVFDWRRLDAWVEAHAAARRTLIYTLYGTPAWAATTIARKDPYGEPGGAAPPRDLRSVEEFVLALVGRYNAEGKRRIGFIETWNEPSFAQQHGDFWCGTAAELAAVGRTAARCAKRVDPGLRILTPGFNGNLAGSLTLRAPTLADARSSPMYQYLTVDDGSGTQASRWCDGIAFHGYNAPLRGANRGFVQEILRLQAMLQLMQVSLPLYDTEFGFLAGDSFHRLDRAAQAMALRRCAAVQAALGVQGIYLYAHDDDLVGNPSLHPEVAEAIGDVHAMIAGKTLKQVTMRTDGCVEIVTAEHRFQW